MHRRFLFPIVAVLTLTGCRTVPIDRQSLHERALALTHRSLVVDTHIDLPYRLQEFPEDVSGRTNEGDFDFVRARAGGLNAPFMAIYIPSDVQGTGREMALADSLIDLVEGVVRRAPEKFAAARTPDDVRRNTEAGLMSLPLGLENGAPIGEDLLRLQHLWDRGIRYITLTHGKDNQICDTSYDSTHTWNGLSPFGRELIPAMNRMGMVIDVSHISDSSFYDVLSLTRAPLVATHSGARAFTPGFERNASDAIIREIAGTGGVVMIPFGSYFLKESFQQRIAIVQREFRAFLAERGIAADAPEARHWLHERRSANTMGSVKDVVDHIDHVAKLVGVDHVGLGSDFDGVYELPEGLEDASMYPNLVEEMLLRGYSDDDVRKVLGENFLRVWSAILKTADTK